VLWVPCIAISDVLVCHPVVLIWFGWLFSWVIYTHSSVSYNVNSCLVRMFGFSIGLPSSINIICFADWEMTSRQPNWHLAFSCVLYAKLTLLQVRASLFMLEASSPPAQRPGKGLSFVLIVAIRRTQWKENAPVELKWRSSNIVLLYSLPF
jgi:hypothetical protein